MAGSFEDRFEIQELVSRYNHAIDFADYDAWVDCFTPDGVFQGGSGRFVGRAELQKFTEQFKQMRLKMPNIRHCVLNTVTEVDGDSATSCSYLQLLTTGGEGTQLLFSGRYNDKVVKVDGRWRFKERIATRDMPSKD